MTTWPRYRFPIAGASSIRWLQGPLVRPVQPQHPEGRQAHHRRRRLVLQPRHHLGQRGRKPPGGDALRRRHHQRPRHQWFLQRCRPAGLLGNLRHGVRALPGRYGVQAAGVGIPAHPGVQHQLREARRGRQRQRRPARWQDAHRFAHRPAGRLHRQAPCTTSRTTTTSTASASASSPSPRFPRLPVPGQPAGPALVRLACQQPLPVQHRVLPPHREGHQQRPERPRARRCARTTSSWPTSTARTPSCPASRWKPRCCTTATPRMARTTTTRTA